MIGAMARIVAECTQEYKHVTITQEQYNQFLEHWTFYALREWRLGQAFLEHFNVENRTVMPLYYFKDNRMCEDWIKTHFLQTDETEVH